MFDQAVQRCCDARGADFRVSGQMIVVCGIMPRIYNSSFKCD
jgi:hypothetical protein